ncbi:MAG TPA: hypothetical protein VNF04_00340 [Stellaceae bacterium]|nr:hypothetical protein [Stellaceae bacterium]
MSAPIPESSLAIPDAEVSKLILGREITAQTRDKLRRHGKWPKRFFVGARAYVLRADIEAFIRERQAAAENDADRFSIRGRRAVETRWARQRDREAAAPKA